MKYIKSLIENRNNFYGILASLPFLIFIGYFTSPLDYRVRANIFELFFRGFIAILSAFIIGTLLCLAVTVIYTVFKSFVWMMKRIAGKIN